MTWFLVFSVLRFRRQSTNYNNTANTYVPCWGYFADRAGSAIDEHKPREISSNLYSLVAKYYCILYVGRKG